MSGSGRDRSPKPRHPLPRGLVELYGLLAVLVVLVPEWMAEGALGRWVGEANGLRLPDGRGAWQRLPELRLAGMGLAELRLLAHDLRLPGYARDGRERLTARLLRRLRRRKAL
ncbi:MAG: hypothetical protein AAFX65_00625 [Cyanobacteria bacterium J06638_7]